MMKMRRLGFLILLLATSLCCLAATNAAPQKRKKVAVVLSGGGAKGVAHIGALKIIEEVGIPVDYIVGTSMGSIIGGLYAIGYTPAQLDSIVSGQDWTFLLSDQVAHKSKSISERQKDETYVLSVPFKKEISKEITGGLIKGQNIANMFSKLTIGYHDSIDFNKLPIPFACVAQDIVTGEEVHFHSGVLSTAMRASMAIPGVFTPVRLDSMVLVDGGMVNNFPVNVARNMGADVVIGVDVQSDLKPASELNSTGTILGQLINLLGLENYKKNKEDTDTYIKVNVEGYSTASFTSNAVRALVQRGEEAARSQQEELARLKKIIGLRSNYTPAQSDSNLHSQYQKVHIREILFDGVDEEDIKWIMRRCNLKEDSHISIKEIEEVTALLCSNLEYSTATYTLPRHPEGGYTLHFLLNKKYERKLNVGLRFDSEETASVQANVSHTFRSKTPATIGFTARLGKRYSARLDFGLEPSPLHRLGASYMFQYNDIDFSDKGDHTHSATFRYHMGELSYSNVWHRNVRYSIGTRYERYNYNKTLYTHDFKQLYQIRNEHFYSYFLQMQYETFDRAYFPTRGVSAQASYTVYTDNFTEYKDDTPFSAIRGHFGAVIPVTNRFSILPDLYGRFLIGKDIPFAKLNCMGGDVEGRYLGHQLPFVGINGAEITEQALLVGSIKLRQRMGSIHYLTLTANYALNASKFKNILEENTLFGCGIGYGMDSMFGPLEGSVNYVNRSNNVSFYLNLGYKF